VREGKFEKVEERERQESLTWKVRESYEKKRKKDSDEKFEKVRGKVTYTKSLG